MLLLTNLTRPVAPQALPALELLLARCQGISRVGGCGGHGGQRRGRDGESVQLAAAATSSRGDVRLGEDHGGDIHMRWVVQVQWALEGRK